MNRKELVRQAAALMRENGIRKPVYTQKYTLHISDDEGNKKDFIVKRDDTAVAYTTEDVEAIIDALLYLTEEAVKRGDTVSIRGFGTLGVNYRKARTTKHPSTGEVVGVDARYVPKFIAGNELRMCAKVYELSLEDKMKEPLPIDDNFEDGEDELDAV